MTGRAVGFLVAAVMLLGQPPESPRQRVERAYRLSNRGVALLEQYDYPAAANAFRESLAVQPSLAQAHLGLAIALLYADQAETALPEARAAEAAMPNAPQPPFVTGLIGRSLNQSDVAEAAFRRVLEIDPGDAASSVNLGQLLLQKRQFPEAVAAFRAAVAAEPYNATAAYGLATALTRSGDATAGRQQTQRFQTLRDSPYSVTYSQSYLQQGRYGEAVSSTGAEADLVDRATPQVTFAETPSAFASAASSGTVLLFDMDRDGDLDLLAVDRSGGRILRNDEGRFKTALDLPQASRPGDETGATAGDYDNDGRPDVFLFGAAGSRLLHQRQDGSFEDRTAAAGLPPDLHARAASWVDVDHDGDLDLVTAAPVRLFRNNGNGTFTDFTREAGLSVPDGDLSLAAAVVPTDFDNRRDVDLLILSGGSLRLFRNMRDGTFQDVASSVGLPQGGGILSVAAADVNKDGFIDFYFGRANAAGVFALSDAHGRFVLRNAPAVTSGSTLAQFFDYDNDGLLDLLIATPGGLRLVRNLGDGWSDETVHAGFDRVTGPVRSLALGDADRDGDTDVIVSTDGGV